jgi:hypothetical protein
MAERSLSMREARGSIPRLSTSFCTFCTRLVKRGKRRAIFATHTFAFIFWADCFADYSQVDVLRVWGESVKFGAGKSPGPTNL